MNKLFGRKITAVLLQQRWLLAILVIGIFLRTAHFGVNPPSMNWDEVSFGYNAYSVLKTGKDEFGHILPLYFRSLDDYKMPVYMYLTVASIRLFGMNDFAVRFPSLLFGLISVCLVYLLGLHLFRNTRAALGSAFAMSIMPWSVMFSRMAAEANVALALSLAGMLMFLKGMKERPVFLFISVLFFGLSGYAYISFRIIGAVMGLLLCLMYFRKLAVRRRSLAALCVPALVFALLFIRDFGIPTAGIRFSGTSFLTHTNEIIETNALEMQQDAKSGLNVPRRIIHDNPMLSWSRIVLRTYLSHFSPDFLLFGGGHKQESSIFSGLVYVWMVPVALYGAYLLFSQYSMFSVVPVLLWVLVSPVPASFTWDAPHAIRTIGLSAGIALLSGLGLSGILNIIMRPKRRLLAAAVFAITVLCILGEWYLFNHEYFRHMPVERSQFWQYSRRELTAYLESVKGSYNKIIISPELEWPYEFMLYYSKYDPAAYARAGGTKSGGWGSESNSYGKYVFRKIHFDKDILEPNALLVGTPDDFSGRRDFIRAFFYLNGSPSVYVFESRVH